MPETHKMNPVGALFSSSWQMYKERFAVLVKIALIPAIFIALGQIMAGQGFPAVLFAGLFIPVSWVLAIFAFIAIIISLDQKTDFNESYRRSASLFWPYLWISILVVFVTFGGYVMLIVPGIILSLALIFSSFALVLENRRGLDALMQSRAYAKGYWWAIFGRYLLFGLCFGAAILAIYLPALLIFGKIIGGLAYGILLLFVTPFSFIYLFGIYKNLVALKPEVHVSQAGGGKTFLTVAAIVGVVAPILFIILFVVLIVLFAKPFLQNNPALMQQLQNQYEYGISTSTATPTGNPAGMHCGGFIKNAPTCPSGYFCKLNLQHPDTGGICLPVSY